MDLRAVTSQISSKQEINALVSKVNHDPKLIKQIVSFTDDPDKRLAYYATWVLSTISDDAMYLIEPHFQCLAELLDRAESDGIRRNILRIFSQTPIPPSLQENLANTCFQIMESNQQPVAHQVFAMTVLANITENIPELKNDLIVLIEDKLPFASAGFQSRGKKILKTLKNL